MTDVHNDIQPKDFRNESAGLTLSKSDVLNDSLPDSLHSILNREAFVIGGGLKDGFVNRLDQAKQNPGATALEFVTSTAVGAGLTAMTLAGGRWNIAAKVSAAALGLMMVEDGASRVIPSISAVNDSISNPGNYLKDRSIVANHLGSALFDYPLMTAGGVLGSAILGVGFKLGSTTSERSDIFAGDKLDPADINRLQLRAQADKELAIARNKFYDIANGDVESNDVRASKISSEDLLGYLKGSEFRNWVAAEKAAGNEVFWPTDVDKTLASGDVFTHFFKWRADNNKFSPEQLSTIAKAVKELVPESTSATPQDALKLWQAKELGGKGIDMMKFWSEIYWPSQEGMSAAEKMAQVKAFAPDYADKVYPLVPEINAAIEDAGAHVVIVSNGDQELARAVAPILGVNPENAVGSNLIYGKDGPSTGVNHTYEINDGQWGARPQPAKPLNFHYWLNMNKSRFGWDGLNENKIVLAGFNGDSAAADGGMMILSKPKGIGNFMVDTPGEPSRIAKFYDLVNKYGWTKGEFVTLERQPSPFDLSPDNPLAK